MPDRPAPPPSSPERDFTVDMGHGWDFDWPSIRARLFTRRDFVLYAIGFLLGFGVTWLFVETMR